MKSPQKSLIVIPARLQSQRLPRKLLLRETGKSVLQHTYDSAKLAELPSGVCVAVDGNELLAEVERFGGKAYLTSPAAPSGTDRIAEVAAHLPDIDIIVNVQGDEPEIEAAAIDQVVRLLVEHPQAGIATLATPIRTVDAVLDQAVVKVVRDDRGQALYFSRSPIPCVRDGDYQAAVNEGVFLQHIGLYAYRREALLQLRQLPASPLESLERLEQLRFLSAGFPICVGSVSAAAKGIDTVSDYRAFVQRFEQRRQNGSSLRRTA